jgi:hypothetical protein
LWKLVEEARSLLVEIDSLDDEIREFRVRDDLSYGPILSSACRAPGCPHVEEDRLTRLLRLVEGALREIAKAGRSGRRKDGKQQENG